MVATTAYPVACHVAHGSVFTPLKSFGHLISSVNSFEARLGSLNARCGVLHDRALVMPIHLEYPIRPDAQIRINGNLDGIHGPLVALLIPDYAYLGWIADMTSEKEKMKPDDYLVPPPHLVKKTEPAYVVREEKASMMGDWSAIVRQLESMYREPGTGGVMFLWKVFE